MKLNFRESIWVIANNSTTAFFQIAYFKSKFYETKDVFVFVESRDFPKSYGLDLVKRTRELEKTFLLPFKINNFENFLFLPKIKYRYFSGFALILFFPCIFFERALNLVKLLKYLKTMNLSGIGPKEIWFGNSEWATYMCSIFPDALPRKFDHGLAELNQYFIERNRFPGKRAVVNFLKICLPGNPAGLNSRSLHTTVFEPSILRYSRDEAIVETLEIVDPVTEIDGVEHFGCGRKNAILLLENIKPWSLDERDHLQYFEALDAFLESTVSSELWDEGVEVLYVKYKAMHSEFCSNVACQFKLLGKKFTVVDMTDISENLAVEFYLRKLRPAYLLGSLSSALFFAHYILPSSVTITYDQWFVRYTLSAFGETFYDQIDMRKLYFEKYKEGLAELLPRSLGTG